MDRRITGVLFDIDVFKAQSETGNYAVAADRIVFRALDPTKIPQVTLLSGDINVPASRRPYSFCIAIEESPFLTGGTGTKHFVERLNGLDALGFFPGIGEWWSRRMALSPQGASALTAD